MSSPKIPTQMNLLHKLDTRTELILQDVANVRATVDNIKESVDKQDARVKNLELWRSLLIGSGIVILGILGYIGDIVIKMLK